MVDIVVAWFVVWTGWFWTMFKAPLTNEWFWTYAAVIAVVLTLFKIFAKIWKNYSRA